MKVCTNYDCVHGPKINTVGRKLLYPVSINILMGSKQVSNNSLTFHKYNQRTLFVYVCEKLNWFQFNSGVIIKN